MYFQRSCKGSPQIMLGPISRRLGRQPTSRHQKNVGKRHITPPYERERMPTRPGGGGGAGGGAGAGVQNTKLWARAPLGDPLLQGSTGNRRDPFGGGGKAAAANGPGSFLKGLGRQVAESGAAAGAAFSSGKEQRGGSSVGGDAGEDGPRRKELYAQN